jgi:hypothetical protein
MSNSFYSASGSPGTGAPGASSTMRSEFLLVQAGFDKVPPFTVATVTGTGAAVCAIAPTIAGTLTASGLVDLSGASAGQIKFPATQNASADVNTLDDYEEGTWTPTLSDASGNLYTLSVAVGLYTKIGNICHAVFTATWTSRVGVDNTPLRLNALPFIAAPTLGNIPGVSFSDMSGLPTATPVIGLVGENSRILFYKTVNLSSITALLSGDPATSGSISGSVTYRTA